MAKRAGQFTVGDVEYPIIEWSAKDYQERRLTLVADVVDLLKRLKVAGGGSAYPFLSLQRLKRLEARRLASRMPEPSQWINNMPRDFDRIQVRARALLVERQKLAVEKIDWPMGVPYDLRKSFATHMARTVAIHTLKDMMGHSSIGTTQEYYLEPDADTQNRVRALFAAASA